MKALANWAVNLNKSLWAVIWKP